MESLCKELLRLSEVIDSVEEKLQGVVYSESQDKVARFCVLLDTLDALRTLQKGVNPVTWDRASAFGELLSWLAELPGSEVSGVAIRETPGCGFGVFLSSTAVEAGELIIRIPQAACITPDYQSPFLIGQCILSLPLPDNMKLVAILMSEASHLSQSAWKTYIKSLPTSFATIMHLDAASVSVLKSSLYFDEVIKRFCNICKHYINCVVAVNMSSRSKAVKTKFAAAFSFDLFRWAFDVVVTRGNGVPRDGQEAPPCIALIPLLDMVNHRENAEKFEVCYSDGQAGFVCQLKATDSMQQDSQIFMSYQSLSAKDRFINHGFITQNEGSLHIFLDFHSVSEEALQMLVGLGLPNIQRAPNGNLTIQPEFSPLGVPSATTLILLRASILNKNNIAVVDSEAVTKPLEPSLEKFAYMLISKTATTLLKMLHQAQPKDTVTLGSDLLRLCWAQRAMERERLEKIISYSSEKTKEYLKLIVAESKRSS